MFTVDCLRRKLQRINNKMKTIGNRGQPKCPRLVSKIQFLPRSQQPWLAFKMLRACAVAAGEIRSFTVRKGQESGPTEDWGNAGAASERVPS